MDAHVPFTQFAQSASLFTLREARDRYSKDQHNRSLLNILHRLKRDGRVHRLANGVYTGAFSALPLDRYQVPSALREDGIVALHSALEWHGLANQVLQTVYYFSIRPRKDVAFEGVTYHRVAPPRALRDEKQRLLGVNVGTDHVLVTERERSFVDCLMFPEYSGGVDELDKSLAMFPAFDFETALEYLKLLRKPWLYSRLGFFLDRHANTLFFRGAPREALLSKLPRGVAYLGDKRPGNRWVPQWKLMVPETLAPTENGKIPT
jgi:predicted transcriptional regulator of viral defense system